MWCVDGCGCVMCVVCVGGVFYENLNEIVYVDGVNEV